MWIFEQFKITDVKKSRQNMCTTLENFLSFEGISEISENKLFKELKVLDKLLSL